MLGCPFFTRRFVSRFCAALARLGVPWLLMGVLTTSLLYTAAVSAQMPPNPRLNPQRPPGVPAEDEPTTVEEAFPNTVPTPSPPPKPSPPDPALVETQPF